MAKREGFKRIKSVDRVIDTESGEVLMTTHKEFSIRTSSEEFFLVFLTELGSLYRLNAAIDIKLLAYLCSIAGFNSCTTYLSPAKRKEFQAMNPGVTTQTVTNSIKRLKELKLLQGDKGEYMINPTVMWKGSIKERDKWMKGAGFNIMINFNDKDVPKTVLGEGTPQADLTDGEAPAGTAIHE